MSIKPQHATPSDWAWLEGNSTVDRCDAAWSRGLVELRARVEALEAAANPVDELQAASAEARPDGLVEKVACAIGGDFRVPFGYKAEARAAILAVADWFEQQGLHTRGAQLRMEAQ